MARKALDSVTNEVIYPAEILRLDQIDRDKLILKLKLTYPKIEKRLVCLECFYKYKEYIPVHLVNNPAKVSHWAHNPNVSNRPCAAVQGESEAHLSGKEYVIEVLKNCLTESFLKACNITEAFEWRDVIKTEYTLPSGRRPDIALLHPRTKEVIQVHEIQVSGIDADTLAKRTLEHQQDDGDFITYWWLGKTALNKADVREICLQHLGGYYQLRYDEDGNEAIDHARVVAEIAVTERNYQTLQRSLATCDQVFHVSQQHILQVIQVQNNKAAVFGRNGRVEWYPLNLLALINP